MGSIFVRSRIREIGRSNFHAPEELEEELSAQALAGRWLTVW